jgi:hypothetical protein
MEFRNYTPFVPIMFESLDVNDTPFQTVVLRGTFKVSPDAPLKPVPDQQPLVLADEFYNEPNTSSVRFESDLAPYKPCSDIVINATAYAPGKKALPGWIVSAQVGQLQKQLLVTGPRHWKHHFVGGWKISDPEPCTEVPIQYEHAYGGQWRHEEEAGVCEENPVGVGFVNKKYLDKNQPVPAPRIMSPDDLIVELGKPHKPEGFSVITKSWLPRRRHAGTYDDQWLKERHPYLPKDFDYAYYNGAHPDLIYNGYLKGDEGVVLKRLHSEHETLRFYLPNYQVGLLLRYHNGSMAKCKVALDTLHLDVHANRAYLVWRGQFQVGAPLRVLEARMTIPSSQQTKVAHG